MNRVGKAYITLLKIHRIRGRTRKVRSEFEDNRISSEEMSAAKRGEGRKKQNEDSHDCARNFLGPMYEMPQHCKREGQASLRALQKSAFHKTRRECPHHSAIPNLIIRLVAAFRIQ